MRLGLWNSAGMLIWGNTFLRETGQVSGLWNTNSILPTPRLKPCMYKNP